MSRTDKDAPWWVRAEFYKPRHDWKCPGRVSHHGPGADCVLPAVPIRRNSCHPRPRPWITDTLQCYWVPADWDRKYYTRPPRRDDRRVYFHGPNRRQLRDFCVKVKQEYAGFGDVESIEPSGRPCSLDWWD